MTTPETVSIVAADQHRFEASLYRAENSQAPVLIFLSALGTPGKVYRGFAAAMAAQGVHVCAPDWRGIASSSIRASRSNNHGYRELVETDAPAVIDKMAELFPGAPLWIGGHSLGGQLGAMIAAANPQRLHGLMTLASGSVYLECFSPKFQRGIRIIGLLARITHVFFGYFPGQRLSFGGREASMVIRDWSHVARHGRYQPYGSSKDYEAAMGRLSIPVLSLNFAKDAWAPKPAATYLLGKLPNCQREQWTWGAEETGGLELDHFSWTKNAQHIAPRIAEWLRTH